MVTEPRKLERFFHVRKAFNSELKKLNAEGGRQRVSEFRKKVCSETGLTQVQLSRFENSSNPSKFQKSGVYHFEPVEQFLERNNLITIDTPATSENVTHVRDNFVVDLERMIEKHISRQTDRVHRAFNDQVMRALMHIAIKEYGRREREDLKFDTLFLKYLGGYRIVSPYPSKAKTTNYVSVSGLYIDKSPYEDLAVFQEILGEKQNRIAYKGICYSVGDIDNLTHFFFSFHTGQIQLMIVKLEVHNREIWLEGTRMNFDPNFGALAVPIVGYSLGKNPLQCFQKQGTEKILDFLSDKDEPFRQEMIERLGFKKKWVIGDYVYHQV